MAAASLVDRLRQRVRDGGPLAVSAYVEAALYDPAEGFYMAGGRAGGRRGDFLTAPETGPLFGAVIARAVDSWWHEVGRPGRFVVHEWGAGPGTLARAVLEAEPESLRTGALRWHMIERSAAQRAMHPDDDRFVSEAAVPAGEEAAVTVANELLDNLPFDVYEATDDGWTERRVGLGDGELTLVSWPAEDHVAEVLARLAPSITPGTPVPWQMQARRWIDTARRRTPAGRMVVIDYGAPTAALGARGSWLRTHRGHDHSAAWLHDPGSCDITTDVATDQVQLDHPAAVDRSQADFLRAHGIEELVEAGRATWRASAHIGDLSALKARSRVREAEALLDPEGMGGFRVLEWLAAGAPTELP